tara:strand:+ start:273 stop:668 length:396 start_codon:yes stop_codon:yes gene_type:complete
MIKIILDTNFFVYSVKQKIDYLKQLNELIPGKKTIIVLSSVEEELKNLIKKARKTEDRGAAELALKILKKQVKKREISVLNTKKHADDAILYLVEENKKTIVATADRELRKKIKGKTRILAIRQKKHLELV